AVAVVGLLLAVAGAVTGFAYLRDDPMEYNMRKLQNEAAGNTEMYRASRISERVIGAKLEASMVVLCENLKQVRELKKVLIERRDAAAPDEKPLEAVHTLLDFVPDEQEKKLPTLMAL